MEDLKRLQSSFLKSIDARKLDSLINYTNETFYDLNLAMRTNAILSEKNNQNSTNYDCSNTFPWC